VIEVADQKGDPSQATFSYALPEVVSITPANGSTLSDPRAPQRAQLCGRNFPLLEPSVEAVVFFGNDDDGTLRPATPAIKMPFDPTPNALQCVQFNVPSGNGPQRKVEMGVRQRGEGDFGLSTGQVTYSYNDPKVEFISSEQAGSSDELRQLAIDTFGTTFRVRLIKVEGTSFGSTLLADAVQR